MGSALSPAVSPYDGSADRKSQDAALLAGVLGASIKHRKDSLQILDPQAESVFGLLMSRSIPTFSLLLHILAFSIGEIKNP